MSIPLYRPFIKRKQMDSVLSSLVNDRVDPGEVTEEFIQMVCGEIGMAGGVAFADPARAFESYLDFLGLDFDRPALMSPLGSRDYSFVLNKRKISFEFKDVYQDSPVMDLEGTENWANQFSLAIIDTELGFFPNLDQLPSSLPILMDLTGGIGAPIPEGGYKIYKIPVILRLGTNPYLECGGGALLLFPGRSDLKAFREHQVGMPTSTLLSDINSSLGMEIFREREVIRERQEEIYSHLAHKLRRGHHILPTQRDEKSVRHFFFPVLLKTGVNEVVNYCRKNGVSVKNAHEDSSLAFAPEKENTVPNAKNFLLRCLVFPMYPGMSQSSLSLVSKVISTLP